MTDVLNNTHNTYSYSSLRYWCTNCNRHFSQLNTNTSGPTYARCPRCNLYADPTPQRPQTNSSSASQPRQSTQQTHNNTSNRSQNPPFNPYAQTFMGPFAGFFAQNAPQANNNNNMFGQLFGSFFQGPSNTTTNTTNFGFFGEEVDPVVLEQFLRDDPNQYGPPPAPKEAMNRLEEVQYDPNREGGVEVTCCPICQEDYIAGENLVRLPCKHEYHRGCVNEWLSKHNSCPMCREAI